MVTFVSKRRSVQELKILLRCERLASLQFSGLSNALLRMENDGKYTMIQSHGATSWLPKSGYIILFQHYLKIWESIV